jgi:hypothetical protein
VAGHASAGTGDGGARVNGPVVTGLAGTWPGATIRSGQFGDNSQACQKPVRRRRPSGSGPESQPGPQAATTAGGPGRGPAGRDDLLGADGRRRVRPAQNVQIRTNPVLISREKTTALNGRSVRAASQPSG